MESNIIIKPLITEKASFASARGVYSFEVGADANKVQITRAIQNLYKVKPIKVNIVNVHPKKIIYRGKPGKKSGFKKAMVYLKEGDKIEVV